MKENNIDIFGFAEINKSMDNFALNWWKSTIRKQFYLSRMIHSESTTKTDSEYKPGGTLTTITGKRQARVSEMGRDNKGLGRWSYIKISSKKSNLIIITAYRPCKSYGPLTAWMQQWSLLREKGIKHPDPIKIFYEDLSTEISKWTQEGAEVILMLDANEPLGERPGGLGNLVGRHSLVDLSQKIIQDEEKVSTYARGSKKIDFIFGTQRVAKYCTDSGIVPYGFGYPSDHRALFIRINIGNILNTSISSIESLHARRLQNATPKERLGFIEAVHKHYQQQNLFDRMQKLREIDPTEWSMDMLAEYERCDTQHINGMLSAEKQISKVKRQAWSPKFGAAISKKAFWKIALSLKLTYTRPSDEYITWAKALGIEDFKSIDLATIKGKLREAQRELRVIEKQTNELRDEHLRELIIRAEDNEADPSFQKRLKEIKRSHERRSQFKKIRSILKPNSAGGLSYILVPKDFQPEQYPYEPSEINEWEPVHEHEILQDFIQKRNITHFGQAHGTPFTQPPLNKLDWQAESIEAKEILQGSIPISLLSNNENANKILHYIANREQLPEIDTFITPDQVSQGFKKWREETSTSPSGCHLGLRRIPAFTTETKESEKMRQRIQAIQASIINLPIGIGFSPSRWQVVVNAMLEKIAGKPQLHKLRVIHILEADYNLALKEIFGRRLMQNCEMHGTLGDRQDGFRKGRSTMRTLLQNELFNDYNKRLRINNFVGMTDISGCFDRILPSIISLINRRNGCPPAAVKTHAWTLKNARYHLKSKHGISDTFYSHTDETPIYGNGQGAGDSPSQWSQESALLFDLYEEAVMGAQMSFRDGIIATKISLTAFADDTNLLGNDDTQTLSTIQLADNTKHAFQTWDKLLHATGHFMELCKCSCYLSVWEFQEDGYAYTIPPEELNVVIKVQDVNGINQIIQQLPTDVSQKLLGVMKNPIGNQQDEVQRLKKKSDQIAMRVNSQLLSHSDAILAYEAFYMPAMRYSLAITAINQMDFERIQSAATTAFLSATGYNRNMPRAIVFAPKIYQGLGRYHLYDIQGCDSTRLLIQELNMKDSATGRMLRAVLEIIQMESGIGLPILEDTRSLDYIEWGWIPQIREFLQHIDGKITNATPNPKTYRLYDRYIMDSEILSTLSYKERMLIHRCRLHLQVEVLSDISDATGERILKQWLGPEDQKPSYSTKSWPQQKNPGNEAWQIWRRFIGRAFLDANGRLQQALGAWTQQNESRVHNSYCSKDTKLLYIQQIQDGRWRVHSRRCAGRRCLIFNVEHIVIENPPAQLIPIDIKSQTTENIITGGWSVFQQTIHKQTVCRCLKDHIAQHQIALSEHISILVEESELVATLKNPTQIEVASDGGFDPNSGISTYGWAIAMNRRLIAKGRGPVAAHPDLAESFRAEGYGLASVTGFIKLMIQYFNITTVDHAWKFYIDNKAMIQRMESYNTNIRHSRWNLRSDADITNKANEYLEEIPAALIHVKSHQDENKNTESLPFDAQMNITADALATLQRECMTKPVTEVKGSFCLLVIKDRHFTHDTKKWLIQTAGEIPIQSYYQKKYGWSYSAFNNIHWELQYKALKTYKQSDQRRILKYAHDWLPTNLRLFREGQEESPACQLCGALEETNDHIMECPNPRQQQLHDKLHDYLWRDNENHGNSELNNIIEIALSECTQNNGWTPDMSAISLDLRPCIQQQNKIGWYHLYKGRIAKDMIRFMEEHFRKLSVDSKRYTGERWGKMLICNIWNAILQAWKQRNEIIHGNQHQIEHNTEKRRLEHRVKEYYQMKETLDASDRERIFFKDLESMLSEDTRYIKAWSKVANRIFTAAKKDRELLQHERKLMETYFAWKPRINKSRQRVQKPRSKAETHPD
jgi:hypothetical protein